MRKEAVLFTAVEWDRASRKMNYIFAEAAHSPLNRRFFFTSFDVESEKGVEASCRYNVKNVPTILILEDGKEIGRIKGFRNEEELVKELKKYGRK